MHRLKVGDAVARPASRPLWPFVDNWIAELAGEDETMQEYFTAETDPPGEDLFKDLGIEADASDSQVSRLEAQLKDFQAQLEGSEGLSSACFDVSRAQLPLRCFSQPGASLDPATLQQLKQLAGPAPEQKQKFEDEVATIHKRSFASDIGPADRSIDSEAGLTVATGSDTAALGSEPGSSGTNGVRGCVARDCTAVGIAGHPNRLSAVGPQLGENLVKSG